MSDHADVIREGLRHLGPFRGGAGEAALDALVAERDEARKLVLRQTEALTAELETLWQSASEYNRRRYVAEARVTALEAANDIAAQEIASAMTSLSTGPAKDGYAYSCLSRAAAALANEEKP